MDKVLESEDKRDIVIGRIPVMVKSELCWMNGAEKDDCDFDHGGYFIVKGAEKVIFSLLFFYYLYYYIGSLSLSNCCWLFS